MTLYLDNLLHGSSGGHIGILIELYNCGKFRLRSRLTSLVSITFTS